MSYLAVSGIVVMISTILGAFFVFLKGKKNIINITWGLFSFFIALWGFGLLMAFSTLDYDKALFWGRMLNMCAIFINASLYHFCCAFVKKNYEKKYRTKIIVYYLIATLYFIITLIFPESFVSGLHPILSFKFYPSPGIAYYFFPIFYMYLLIESLVFLRRDFVETTSSQRKIQIKYLTIGLLLSFLGGATTFPPVFNISLIPPVGTFIAPVYVLLAIYAIIKYSFLDIKIAIKLYGAFLVFWSLSFITPFIVGFYGKEWLVSMYPNNWWVILISFTTITAISGQIIANYFKKKAEQEITKEFEVRSNKERFILLGQLIGGIAHNMKTPIMAMGGWVAHERELITEYEESLGDKSITEDDYREIAKEMREGCTKVMTQLQYMTEVIDTIRGQAMELQDTSRSAFDIRDVVKRVDLLLESELRRNKCFLRKEVEIDEKTVIAGEVSNLVQVLANLINNAMHAYRAKGGEIIFHITKDEKDILIMLQDFGVGIPERVQKDLFQTMVTTKGKFGTGLGLLMSKSTIKARFDGNITFTSKEGEGSTFCIHIPLTKIVPLPA